MPLRSLMQLLSFFFVLNGAACQHHGKKQVIPSLIEAIKSNNKKLRDAILKKGQAPNEPDGHQHTPLHWACYLGHIEDTETLIKAGANVHAIDQEGNSALHWAIASPSQNGQHQVDLLNLLMGHHADIDVQNKEGKTALHDAVILGKHGAIACLLHKNAKREIKDTNQKTPLVYAQENDDKRAIDLLTPSSQSTA